MCSWRFKSLNRLFRVGETFPSARIFQIRNLEDATTRQAEGGHYVIISDAFINLPFHAINIRPDSPNYGEVICAAEEGPWDAYLAKSTFEEFAKYVADHPDDPMFLDPNYRNS